MFKTLPGFRAFYPEDCARRNLIFGEWRKTAESFGFLEFDPPVLEQIELFTEKSGEEIRSQLFGFFDKGGREVSLRPEMTPSLARMVGERAGGIRRPVKWFAIGENYRYERQQKGRLRAFFQFNADILGEPSVNADAEVIALLISSLRALGLTSEHFKLRLGDRKLWALFLENEGVPEDKMTAVLSAIDKLEKVSEEAFLEIVGQALGAGESETGRLVSRVREFIKLSDIEEVGKAFDGGVVPRGEIGARLDDWRKLAKLLESLGVGEFVQPDLGIVRGLAYYTGFVFEAFQIVGKGRALAGGGRYDSLVGKFGYQDMPAVGFGMGDVTVADLLELVGLTRSRDTAAQVYVVIGGEQARPDALRLISCLRKSGFRVDYPLKQQNFGKQFAQASAIGARVAVVLGADELAGGYVKVKDLADSSEDKVSIECLEGYLRRKFGL